MSDKTGNGGEDDVERRMESYIDAINELREEMRVLGVSACADAMDVAFAKCLAEFLRRRDAKSSDPGGHGRSENDLN